MGLLKIVPEHRHKFLTPWRLKVILTGLNKIPNDNLNCYCTEDRQGRSVFAQGCFSFFLAVYPYNIAAYIHKYLIHLQVQHLDIGHFGWNIRHINFQLMDWNGGFQYETYKNSWATLKYAYI